MTFATITEIKRANELRAREQEARTGEKAGRWFGPDEMRFFGTKIESGVLGGRYFVTSEQPPHSARTFNVRRARDDGSIDAIGPSPSDGIGTRDHALFVAMALGEAERTGAVVVRTAHQETYQPCTARPCRDKDHANWATFVVTVPGEDEPFNCCAECLPGVVTAWIVTP